MNMADQTDTKKILARRRKVLYAAIVVAAFLLVLEIIFRAFGLFAPEDPFTLFTGPDGKPRVRYELSGLKPEFEASKQKGALRIMIAGESTALGFPYLPRSSFGARLAALLADTLPDTRVEVINLGRMGFNAAQVEEVVNRALDFQPDLVIVYSGQNEFISGLRANPLFSILQGLNSGKGLGRVRVARMIGMAVTALTGGVALTAMKSFEEDPEPGLNLPPPEPLPESLYNKVLEQYRCSLQKIAADCNSRGVPLILCTMASNLRDWPPDLRAVPPGFPEMSRRQALEAIFKARELARQKEAEPAPAPPAHQELRLPVVDKQGDYEEAIKTLSSAREASPGYAPLSFELGRIKTSLVELGMKKPDREEDRLVLEGDSLGTEDSPTQPLMGLGSDLPGLDPAYVEKLRGEALADFKRALDEEARVSLAGGSNRAPLAVNAIIREVAAANHALLFDTEKAIEESSYLAPGFDWFDDHCHPNLWGQQVIAEALYDLIRENAPGLWSKLEWTEPSPWDEDAFRAENNIDDKFLHDVFLRMGIYLGLEKDLPDRSAETREKLRQAAEKDPSDPLPIVLEAAVAADYGESAEAVILLKNLYPARRPDLEKCLARYFAAAELRQGVFMARLRSAPGNPPLRGLLKSGLFKSEEGKKDLAEKPLDSFNFFLDLDAGADISDTIKYVLVQRSRNRGGTGPLVLADPAAGLALKPGPGARLVRVDKTAHYVLDDPGAFLTTGAVRIKPLDYNYLVIDIKPEGASAPAGPRLPAVIAWSGLDTSGRPAEAFAPIPQANAGGVEINLSLMPRWVMAREITEIRIIPGRAGTLTLAAMRLVRETR
jgi:hypothetical protein